MGIAAGALAETGTDKDNASFSPPVFEVYPPGEETRLPSLSATLPQSGRPKPSFLPAIAIIIDDIGFDWHIVDKFLSLDIKLTFSILPFAPDKDIIIRKIRKKGLEMMLHLPMEPREYPKINPGPDALMAYMSPDKIRSSLIKILNKSDFAKGVNNHMGSRLTSLPACIYPVLSIIKKRGLFFIDSFTGSESACASCAKILNIPFARRDIFLDHVQTKKKIKEQIIKLATIANICGEAVGIGHPHPITFEVLKNELSFLKENVRIVPASKIVHVNSR